MPVLVADAADRQRDKSTVATNPLYLYLLVVVERRAPLLQRHAVRTRRVHVLQAFVAIANVAIGTFVEDPEAAVVYDVVLAAAAKVAPPAVMLAAALAVAV